MGNALQYARTNEVVSLRNYAHVRVNQWSVACPFHTRLKIVPVCVNF